MSEPILLLPAPQPVPKQDADVTGDPGHMSAPMSPSTAPDVVEPQTEVVEYIDSYPIRREHKIAFELWAFRGWGALRIARRIHRNKNTVEKWMHTGWWEALRERHLKKYRNKFEAELVSRGDKVLATVDSILEGKDSATSKIASAQVNLIDKFMKAGKQPIIDQRPINHVDTSTKIQNNNITITPELLNKVLRENPGAIREYHRTGKLPEGLG